LLRYRGQRLPWRDVQNGQPYVGDLRTHLISHKGTQFQVATLFSAEPLHGNMVPQLYTPVLDGFSTLAFRLRGFERHPATDGGCFSVVQEWHIELP
jgi:hypothetical protein